MSVRQHFREIFGKKEYASMAYVQTGCQQLCGFQELLCTCGCRILRGRKVIFYSRNRRF